MQTAIRLARTLAPQLGEEAQDPSRLVGRVGVLARVKDRSDPATGTAQVTLAGIQRVRIGALTQHAPYPIAAVAPVIVVMQEIPWRTAAVRIS